MGWVKVNEWMNERNGLRITPGVLPHRSTIRSIRCKDADSVCVSGGLSDRRRLSLQRVLRISVLIWQLARPTRRQITPCAIEKAPVSRIFRVIRYCPFLHIIILQQIHKTAIFPMDIFSAIVKVKRIANNPNTTSTCRARCFRCKDAA